MSNTLPTVTTAVRPSSVEQAIALRQSIQNLPATVNNRSIAVVEKATSSYGDAGVVIAGLALSAGASFYLGKLGAQAAGPLVLAGADSLTRDWAVGLGAAVATAPMFGGFISACTKDGWLRGVAEGLAFVTLPYFAGQLIGASAVGSTVAGNWVGVLLAGAGAALYISGNVKRHG